MADLTKAALTQGTAARRKALDPALSDALMERVLAPENWRKAWHRVKATQGAPGVEGLTSEDCPALAREHWPRMRQALRDETSQPFPVRRPEMPKRHGQGKRVLGIPTGGDRVSQQASAPGLGPLCDPECSASSFGLRPGRAAPHAVKPIQAYIKAGYRVAGELDRAKFFARVSHEALLARGARQVREKARRRLRGK